MSNGKESPTPMEWLTIIPGLLGLVKIVKDWFEKTEEEELRNQIEKYDEWHSRYVSFMNGGKKRKNMLTLEAYVLLTEPLYKRLEQIRLLETSNSNP